MDLIIKSGLVYDGLGNAPRKMDIGVKSDRIVAIQEKLNPSDASSVFDATGLAVCPGFIDSHTHDDSGLTHDGGKMMPKISQGVTTVVTGNCGISLAPLSIPSQIPVIRPIDLLGSHNHFLYESFSSWMGALERNPPTVNYLPFVGHTTLRWNSMSYNSEACYSRPAKDTEIQTMKQLVEEAMKSGSAGLSTGLAYDAALSSPQSEVIELAKVVAQFNGMYSTHIRNEGKDLEPSIEEALTIGKTAGVPVIISHLKSLRPHQGRVPHVLSHLDTASLNQHVTADVYPYNASSTILKMENVNNATKTMVTWSVPHPEMCGRLLTDIASDWNMNDISAVVAKLQPAGAVYWCMEDADVQCALKHSNVMVGSDGLFFDSHPHPRLWGTFPRVLGYYCREKQLLSLEEGIRKMTGLTAQKYGIPNRGIIKLDYYADLCVFSPQEISDTATFENPKQLAKGIKWVFCNGKLIYDGKSGSVTEARPGRLIKRHQ